MTDDELIGIAAQAFNMARRDIKRGNFVFFIGSYFGESKLKRLRLVEETIIERFGRGWPNSGRAKDAAFTVIRMACDEIPPEAVVFASHSNFYMGTPESEKLSKFDLKALMEGSTEVRDAAVEAGLLKLFDALSVTAQTSDRVCFYVREVDNNGEPVGESVLTHVFSQEGFGGRQKMYGDIEDQRKEFHSRGAGHVEKR